MDYEHYTFFLFDFDGLLVNTEHLHFKAYKQVCSKRGVRLDWSMATYASYALFCATAVKEAIFDQFPHLEKEATWETLYDEKKECYLDLLESEALSLMPGVERLLKKLSTENIKSCVVTNSPLEQIESIKERLPLLKTIPHWITREDYKEPKPHPDSYLTALTRFARPGDRVVGFEDSPRGLKALLGASVEAVLVSTVLDEEQLRKIRDELKKPFVHIPSFTHN